MWAWVPTWGTGRATFCRPFPSFPGFLKPGFCAFPRVRNRARGPTPAPLPEPGGGGGHGAFPTGFPGGPPGDRAKPWAGAEGALGAEDHRPGPPALRGFGPKRRGPRGAPSPAPPAGLRPGAPGRPHPGGAPPGARAHLCRAPRPPWTERGCGPLCYSGGIADPSRAKGEGKWS